MEHTEWRGVDSFDSTPHAPDPEVWDDVARRVLTWLDYMPEWYRSSACASIEDWDEVYFGETENTRPSFSVARLRSAQAICAQCPVLAMCARHALTKPEEHGIWAGTTPLMREKARDLIVSGIIDLEEAVEVICEGAMTTFKELADAIDTGLKDVI